MTSDGHVLVSGRSGVWTSESNDLTWQPAVKNLGLTINNDVFTAGRPNASAAEVRRADYSYASYDRPHNFVVNFVYQTPKVASGGLGA